MRAERMHSVSTRAPGRINIIGEHTDYNDGFVLPCAIAYDTRVLAEERPDRMVTVRSRFDEPAAFDLDRLPAQRRGGWTDYVRGVLIELRDAGVMLCGGDVKIAGTVPIGAGLSSSASVEIAFALAMIRLAGTRMDPLDLARLAQRVENEHVGARSGIMDQYAVLFARAGYAVFLDTRTLQSQLIEIPPGLAIVVCNTMVRHDLAAGEYNERRRECEQAVRDLQARYPAIRALRDVTLDQLQSARSVLSPVQYARARHVVSENERVLAAVQTLRDGEFALLGKLLYDSHASLRDDYAVSCPELDLMVELARGFDGTVGARMTGGGFGGCTVNLVHAGRSQEFASWIASAYRKDTGIVPEVYDGTPSAGARIVDG
jgi:galactokinase